MARRVTRHPTTVRVPFGDRRAMAAHWGLEAVRAIRDAIATPAPATIYDLDLEHAIRSARVAAWHALRVLGKEQE